MKRLVLIRHAKTIHDGYDNDYNRHLTERGFTDARLIATKLKEKKFIPDYIISSPAIRAITTAKILAETLGYIATNIKEAKSLYFEMTTQEFIENVQDFDDSLSTVFVVGHNPFIGFISSNMSSNFFGDMPTSSTVVLDFDMNKWSEIEPRLGKMVAHLTPQMFK